MSRLTTVSPNGRSLAPVTSSSTQLVMLADPHSPAAEAYRSLAANLQFAYADRQLPSYPPVIIRTRKGQGKAHWEEPGVIALPVPVHGQPWALRESVHDRCVPPRR